MQTLHKFINRGIKLKKKRAPALSIELATATFGGAITQPIGYDTRVATAVSALILVITAVTFFTSLNYFVATESTIAL